MREGVFAPARAAGDDRRTEAGQTEPTGPSRATYGRLAAVVAALAAVLAAPPPVRGQAGEPSTATVTGVVRDEQGRPLEGASVAAPALGRGTLTGPDGRFRLEGLPVRELTLQFRMLGRKTVARRVALRRGSTVDLEVVLSPRPLESEEITVTGTPTAASPLEAVQDVEQVSSEEIASRTSPALGDLLQERVAGVSSVSTGAQGGKPVLRGLTGQRIRVLQDGIAQEYFQYGVRHFPPTDLSQAGQVEVVRGAASILYGSAALGGAVNVLTRELPADPDGGVRSGGRVHGSFDTNNEQRTAGVDAYAARGGFGVRVGGQRRVAGDLESPDVPTFFETGAEGAPKYSGEIPFTNFDQWSGYAQAGYQGSFGVVKAVATHWRNDQNFLLPGGGPAGSRTDPPVGLGQHLEHTNVSVSADAVLDGFVVKPQLSYQRALRQSAAPRDTIEGDPAFPIDIAKDVYTGRVELRHPDYGPLEGRWGVEVDVEDTDARGPVELEPPSDVLNVGAFVFEDLKMDRVTVSGGVRYDYRTQEAAPNRRTADPRLLDQSFSEVTGGVGVNWRFARGLALAGNFSSGFRAPNMFELFAEGVEGGVAAFQRGNPRLGPERSFSVDLGLRVRRGPVRGKLTVYRNEIRDFIFLENTGETHAPSGLPVFARGQTDATLRGLEGSIHVAASPWLELGARGSALDTEGDGLARGPGGEPREGTLPLVPADRFGAHVQFSPSLPGRVSRTRIEISADHVFPKDAAGPFEPFAQFDRTPFGTASTDAYTLLHLEARGTFELAAVPVSLQVSVDNLTDEVHRDFLDTYKGYALSAGRSITTRVSVPFGGEAGP